MLLQGYKAVITGGSGGIGFAIAQAFVDNGASVWIVGRDQNKLDAALRQLQTAGVEVLCTAADISDRGGVSHVVQEVTATWQSLDVLVNNAAIGRFKPFTEVVEEDLQMHFSLNVYAPYRLTQQLLPYFSPERGSVINISSYFGQRMMPLLPSSVYSATKGAINAWTKALAVELGPDGLRVNAIAPGTVRTPQVEHNIGGLPDEQRDAVFHYVKQNYALQRIGEPSEVAGLAVYLASDQARWATGGVFNVDGGLTAT